MASSLISTVTSTIGASLVLLATIPALRSLLIRLRHRKIDLSSTQLTTLYADDDGSATEDSQASFSTSRVRFLAAFAAVSGTSLSIALATCNTVERDGRHAVECWLVAAAWMLLLVQVVVVSIVQESRRRFVLGAWAGGAACVVMAVLVLENVVLKSRASAWDLDRKRVGTLAGQGVAAIGCALTMFAIRRRPVVFREGDPVDGEMTVSMLEKYTFSWAVETLNFARKNQTLTLDNIPRISKRVTAQALQEEYRRIGHKGKLWMAMALQFKWTMIRQIILAAMIAVTQFGPQFAMFHLLQLLEVRSEGAQVAGIAWAWVLALGAAMLATTMLESWLYFIIMAQAGLPILSLLSILVYSKSARRKDVKGVPTVQPKADEPTVINAGAGAKGEDVAKGTAEEDETGQKSRQSTINLVGVDSKRVSDFSTYFHVFPMVVCKLTVSMVFLYNLIGAWPLLSGLLTFFLSIPFNVYWSKKFNHAQGEIMKVRDQKMAVVTEALQGIRQIKFSALEGQWQDKIGEKRRKELEVQWKVFKYDVGLISLWIFGPVMLSAVSLAVYAFLHGDLSPSIAFTTIAVLGQIEGTLAVLPELTTDAIEAFVSLGRIEEYLNAPEKIDCTEPAPVIAFGNASIAWPSDVEEKDEDRFVLRNVTLQFPPKELSVISGKTGSGKSLLLASILGEIDRLSGTIKVPSAPSLYDRHDAKSTKGNWILDSSIAFVAQIPWIENATIKDNILFGLPHDSGRYSKVLQCCALEKDLAMLPDGELTDIGANGINLSGGQRWRVSFARALYSRAGILILDDIFSAVDAHVGKQLFEEALTGELGLGRTRILVTHHVSLCLPKTKYTVLLGDGTVVHAGSPEDLRRTGSLDQILKLEESPEDLIDDQDEGPAEADFLDAHGHDLTKVMSHRSGRSAKIDESEMNIKGNAQPKKFTEDEKRETGTIKVAVYQEYFFASGGWKIWSPLAVFFVMYMCLVLGRSWWINIWTRSYQTEDYTTASFYLQGQVTPVFLPPPFSVDVQSTANGAIWFYLGIYVGLSITLVGIGTVRYFMSYLASIRASKVLFDKLCQTVLRAPLRWLDTVPVGRVLNRFTADFNMVDSKIAGNMGFFFYQLTEVIGIMIAGVMVSPLMLLFAVALLVLALRIALRYLQGAREVKRLESNAKSPIFEHFGATLAGIGTIRAFDKAEEYIDKMNTKIDTHIRAYWHICLFNRWMALRLNIVGGAFAIIVACIIVASTSIDASLAGFALAFALQYSGAVIWTLRCYANLEMDMNATERIVEYASMPTEDQSGTPPPASWPTEGRLEVRNLVAGYAPDLPPVLQGLSFTVERGQRVGVVGRTGAGKSSLTLALFRFLEAREGSVFIDGLDVSTIPLHDLRSRLAIIPQDPVLFSGTVRSNLDPFDRHGDAELCDALERVHLVDGAGNQHHDETSSAIPRATATLGGNTTTVVGDTNTNLFRSLGSRIGEGGLNLSQGQRQLLCLARAIVARPRIMLLDEATSAVDMATDVLIQRSIRAEFASATLLVIAHRLSTIADFDRILVMSEGRAVEFGRPRALWDRRGVFWDMVESSGEREALVEVLAGADAGAEGGGGDL